MIHEIAIGTERIDEDVEKLMAAGYSKWNRKMITMIEQGSQYPARLATSLEFVPDVAYTLVEIDEHNSNEDGSILWYGFTCLDELEVQWSVDRFDLGRDLSDAFELPGQVSGDFTRRHRLYQSGVLPHKVRITTSISVESIVDQIPEIDHGE